MNDEFPPNKQLFFDQVWEVVRQIPYGKVATYGQLTKLLPQLEGVSTEVYRRSAAQWVGLAMGACPDDVPWQRVINSQGKISHQAQASRQKELLEAEGVLFLNQRIDLNQFQWRAPGEDEHPQQGNLF